MHRTTLDMQKLIVLILKSFFFVWFPSFFVIGIDKTEGGSHEKAMSNKLNTNVDNDFIETMCESKIYHWSKVDSNRCDIRRLLYYFIERIDCCIGSDKQKGKLC